MECCGYCRVLTVTHLIGTVDPFAFIFFPSPFSPTFISINPILSTLRIPWTTQDGRPADGLHMRLVWLKPLRQFLTRPYSYSFRPLPRLQPEVPMVIFVPSRR